MHNHQQETSPLSPLTGNNPANPLQITPPEAEAVISVFFKVLMSADMEQRNITQWDDYIQALAKDISRRS